MVGAVGVTATVGDTLIIGTAAAELTPRLPISKDPNGIPVRATPPGVMGVVEVGVDDEVTLLEPEPHIPDIPAVSSIPEVVDTPDVLKRLAELEIPDVDAPDIAALPAVPVPIPPPSKLAVDPNIDDGEVPTVEHAVPLVVLGIEIVPVTPVGTGLSPAEVISVEPSGMPVGPTDVPGLSPSGEVAPRLGVVGIAPTCAIALLQANRAESATAISANLACALCFAAILPGARLSDIGQSLWRRMKLRERITSLPSQGAIRGQFCCSAPEGGHLARPVQLNTRLLSWPTWCANGWSELLTRPRLEAKNKFN
jgi:hypothetical protein